MKFKFLFFLTLSFACLGQAQIPTTGLKVYFPFTGNAKDSSGNNYHGTTSNVTLVNDRFGNANSAYKFYGKTNSYINFPSTGVVNNEYTYSAWLRVDTLPSSGSTAAFMEIGQGGNGTGQQMMLHNSYLSVHVGLSVGGYNTTSPNFGLNSNSLPTLGTWYHLANVRGSNYVKMYINGSLKDSHGVSNTIYPKYGSPVKAYIGIRADLTAPINAVIDDICIYNRAVTPAEIQQLYKAGIKNSEVTPALPSIAIYPNPATGKLMIQTSFETGPLDIRMIDASGRMVMEKSALQTGMNEVMIDKLKEGTYFLQCFNQAGVLVKTHRLLKLN